MARVRASLCDRRMDAPCDRASWEQRTEVSGLQMGSVARRSHGPVLSPGESVGGRVPGQPPAAAQPRLLRESSDPNARG